MALSATFTANFSSFYDAVDKAETKLKDFGAGADKVGGRLTALGNSFSGVKIIQDATLMVKAVEDIGGTAKLTEKELARLGSTANEAVAKMKALGMDVPKSLQKIADETKNANKSSIDWMGTLTKMAGAIGIAFSVDAIVGFVGSVFDAASAVKDLSLQWGFSTDAVQKWKGAARDSGITTDALGKSIMFVTEKLEENSVQYDALLANIGLSGPALRAMKMEDAYREILKALTAVKDETLQYDLALGILGPSAKLTIGGIRDGIVDATEAQSLMTKETIKRLSEAEDAWGRFKDKVVIYTGEIIAKTASSGEIMFSSWSKFLSMAGLAVLDPSGQSVERYAQKMRAAATVTGEATGATEQLDSSLGGLQGELKTTAQVTENLKKKEEARKKALEAAAKAQAEAKRVEDAYTKTLEDHDNALNKLMSTFSGRDVIGKAEDYLAALKMTIPIEQMTATQKANINKVMDEAIGTYQALGQMAPKVMYDVWQATAKAGEGVVVFTGQMHSILEVIGEVNKHPIDLGDGFKMSDAPPVSLFDKYGASVANLSTALHALGSQTGGVFGDITAGLGNVAAAMDAGKTSAEGFRLGMEQFKPGGDLVLGVTQVGAAAAAAAATFLQLTEGAGILESTITGAAMGFGLATPALGAFGLVAGAVLGYVRGLHTAAASRQEFYQMRGDFLMLASGATQTTDAIRLLGEKIKGATGEYALLTQLLQADSQWELQRAATAIAEAFQFQAQALGHVNEAAERYGITIEELGPAMQRQKLDEQAAQLYKDWQVLNQAGIDTAVITEKMGDEMSAYLQQAAKMGTDVPIAMKPMIESMIKAGTLTDENGVAFEDLEATGISFAMTMSEGFKGMIEEVKKLTDAISRSLGLAITNIPQPTITGKVTWDVEEPESKAKPHGDGGEHSYARGTGGFVNFGKGTPAILHGWEAVVPRDDAASFATVTGAGGGGMGRAAMPAIVINAQGAFFDRPEDLQRLANKVGDALTARYSVMGKLRAAV